MAITFEVPGPDLWRRTNRNDLIDYTLIKYLLWEEENIFGSTLQRLYFSCHGYSVWLGANRKDFGRNGGNEKPAALATLKEYNALQSFSPLQNLEYKSYTSLQDLISKSSAKLQFSI